MGKTYRFTPLFSEAGADSFMAAEKDAYAAGENQIAQADATTVILDQIFARKDRINGVTLFSFTDGWKAGNPEQQDQGGWAPLAQAYLMMELLMKNIGAL